MVRLGVRLVPPPGKQTAKLLFGFLAAGGAIAAVVVILHRQREKRFLREGPRRAPKKPHKVGSSPFLNMSEGVHHGYLNSEYEMYANEHYILRVGALHLYTVHRLYEGPSKVEAKGNRTKSCLFFSLRCRNHSKSPHPNGNPIGALWQSGRGESRPSDGGTHGST